MLLDPMSNAGPSDYRDNCNLSDDELEHFTITLANIDERKEKLPYQIPALPGTSYMKHILEGPPVLCFNLFRMYPSTFNALCALLRTSGYIDEKKNKSVSLEESVAIFLYVVGHRNTQRGAADRFPHSTHTINTHFKIVMRALARLAPTIIRLSNGNDTPIEIENNPQFYPWFKVKF